MIHKLEQKGYSKAKDLLRRRCGVAALEWLNKLDGEKEKIEIYIENRESPKGCMVLHGGINVFITTDSEATLKEFLGVLDEDKDHAFRCSEWMAPVVMEKFKPREASRTGVILLTYSTDKSEFRKYTDQKFVIQPVFEDSAEEVLRHTRRRFTLEFIREKIRKGYFYGIYDNNELISWVGTLWEGNEAYEIGFAYTKEEHRGKGLIKIVISVVTEKALKEGKIPILHTVETNGSAIRAFEALGYSLEAREWAYFSSGVSKK